MKTLRDNSTWLLALSPGAWSIVAIAIVSSALIAVMPEKTHEGKTFWLFSPPHRKMYEPTVAAWNERAAKDPTIVPVRMVFLSIPALERRMLSAFYGQTASAELIEVERAMAGRVFTGPLESVGFLDLTERLERGGWMEKLNTPSFAPWTSRGRVFGIPHDVHPVMLGYRADLVEAAGIDVTTIKTWDDFARVMKPLVQDTNGDGVIDRYPLSMWPTHVDHLELLLLQGGGGFFDAQGRLVIDREVNAAILARVVMWCIGEGRIADNAMNFTLGGNQMKADGSVVCSFFPDWMGDVWKGEIPTLAGKMKLMPLPAWGDVVRELAGDEAAERRTSVWGGTMLGLPKATASDPESVEKLWAFAEEIYLSEKAARRLWEGGGIITPVKSFWGDSMFDVPNAYFSGQAVGRMYIDLAPSVPERTSSPYNAQGQSGVVSAVSRVFDKAKGVPGVSEAQVREWMREELRKVHEQVRRAMARNTFWRDAAGAAEGGVP